jgi:two-component system chemotaxis response regulator CheB
MPFEHLVVLGASAGGVEAVSAVASRLEPDFPAPICVVVHTSPDFPSMLAGLVARAGVLPAELASSGTPLVAGKIVVPPADHHLLIEPGRLQTSRGPKENRTRPAVDPLFRSAAQVYGPRVIGVVLTGGLDDRTAGLWTIKQMGGIAIVQDPADAVAPSMPEHALNHVAVDHCVALAEIGPLLNRLVRESVHERSIRPSAATSAEVSIARGLDAMEAGVEKLGTPSIFACPECHGVLIEVAEGGRTRYRCHTGHAAVREDEKVEQALYNAMRALEERQMLLEQLAGQEPDPQRAARLGDDHARARDAVATVRDLIRSTVATAASQGSGK